MYYVEFFRRRPGVSHERFREVVSTIYDEWRSITPEDEILLVMGRTWRMGPAPGYIAITRCEDLARIDDWEELVSDARIHGKMNEFLAVAIIEHAGLFEDLGQEQVWRDGARWMRPDERDL